MVNKVYQLNYLVTPKSAEQLQLQLDGDTKPYGCIFYNFVLGIMSFN